MPSNCGPEFKDSAAEFVDAQTKFVSLVSHMEETFHEIVEDFSAIYRPDPITGEPTGILPDAVRAGLQPAMNTTVYLGIVGVATFLILLGVVFTL